MQQLHSQKTDFSYFTSFDPDPDGSINLHYENVRIQGEIGLVLKNLLNYIHFIQVFTALEILNQPNKTEKWTRTLLVVVCSIIFERGKTVDRFWIAQKFFPSLLDKTIEF